MAVFITTIVAAVVTALFGMVSYLYQKRTDRRVDLSKQQREAYTLYTTSYYDWLLAEAGSDEEAKEREKYWRAYHALFPLASDGFLQAAMRFHAYAMAGTPPDFHTKAGRVKLNDLWINLILEMRNDANVESRISMKDLEDYVPWSFPSYEPKQGSNVGTSTTPSSQERDEE